MRIMPIKKSDTTFLKNVSNKINIDLYWWNCFTFFNGLPGNVLRGRWDAKPITLEIGTSSGFLKSLSGIILEIRSFVWRKKKTLSNHLTNVGSTYTSLHIIKLLLKVFPNSWITKNELLNFNIDAYTNCPIVKPQLFI